MIKYSFWLRINRFHSNLIKFKVILKISKIIDYVICFLTYNRLSKSNVLFDCQSKMFILLGRLISGCICRDISYIKLRHIYIIFIFFSSTLIPFSVKQPSCLFCMYASVFILYYSQKVNNVCKIYSDT